MLARTIEWLKANGNDYAGNGTAFAFTCNDAPYMEFSAEWQDWHHTEVLMVGYHSVEYGDLCHDPQVIFTLKDGEITDVQVVNTLAGTCISGMDSLKYALDFAVLVYDRHCACRHRQQETP